MNNVEMDTRSVKRRALDEEIAAEPHLPPPELPINTVPIPMEVHLRRAKRQPVAFAGVVENGVVRLLDTNAKLPELSRVIVVAESA